MIDPDSGLCAGCFRTIEEIGSWSVMTEEEREKVWSELPQRKAGNSLK
ncbi:PF06945 family protein [Leptospira meyeri serovar Hardjo str. Went 5]|nr:PF06945 family protein [Leptospira meyeri serovar Hardjo str. Went 5]